MKKNMMLVLVVLALMLVFPVMASAGHKFKFKAINVTGSVETVVYGINGEGKVVGTFATPADVLVEVEHGFTRSSSGKIKMPFDVPNSFDTDFDAISNEADIFGHYADNGPGLDHCFILDDGVYGVFDVALTGAAFPDCTGINRRGTTVGTFTGDGTVDTNNHGWIRTEDGVFTQVDYPGSCGTEVNGINDKGDIVGEYFDCGGGAAQPIGNGNHGFVRWHNGTFSAIDFPGVPGNTVAYGINNRRDIVGSYTDSVDDHGFLLTRDGLYISVDVTLPSLETNNLRGINDDGWMIGNYTDLDGNNQGFITRKPD